MAIPIESGTIKHSVKTEEIMLRTRKAIMLKRKQIIIAFVFYHTYLIYTLTYMHFDGFKAPTSPTIPEAAKISPVQIPHPTIYSP